MAELHGAVVWHCLVALRRRRCEEVGMAERKCPVFKKAARVADEAEQQCAA
jgi:hypothetical protein